MTFLTLLSTVRCSENNSNSKDLKPLEVTPLMIRDILQSETPRDRIRRMYSKNEFGYSPEMLYAIQTGSVSAFLAAVFGAFRGMNAAKNDFLRKNVASTFESQHLARRSLTDTMSLAGINGAWKSGLKYGSFTYIYLLSTMTVANYRDKISPWEHCACAALLGGVSRFNYGIKGMLVAGGLGGFLGLIAGGVITLSMRLSGTTLEELRYYQHEDHYAKILRDQKRKKEKNKPA